MGKAKVAEEKGRAQANHAAQKVCSVQWQLKLYKQEGTWFDFGFSKNPSQLSRASKVAAQVLDQHQVLSILEATNLPGLYSQVLAASNLLLSGKRLLASYSSASMSLVWFVVTCFMLPKQHQLTTVTALKTPCCHHLSQLISTRPRTSGAQVLGLIHFCVTSNQFGV